MTGGYYHWRTRPPARAPAPPPPGSGTGTGPTMTVSYFAYASNMAPEVIGRLCQRHRYLGVASLADHRLSFTRRSVKTGTGVADIVPALGETVWGVVYEIGHDEMVAIERKEGSGWAYQRIVVPVRMETSGERRTAVTFTVISKEPAEVPPSHEYLDQVIRAARERGLPRSYVERLAAVGSTEKP
jgi:gamma-glutamylcyclotransferase